MFSKKNKASNPKTQEQMLRDLKQNAEFLAKMKFIKEQFYPALINATTSIEDALQNLTIINSVMMEKFLGAMKEKKFKDIDIYTNLSKSDPKHDQLETMLHLFDDMTIFEAKEYLEGMKHEIALFQLEESRERTLESLKAKWADEK